MSKKIMDINERKIVQLGIMDSFHRFCIEHGLTYSLAAGSLLGAVRHNGYIPWDDDIDICMLRKDYEKLESLFPNVLDGKYKMASMYRIKGWHIPYAKIYDDSTILIENKYSTEEIGVNIDVYVVDDAPGEQKPWKRQYKQFQRFNKLLAIKNLKLSRERNFIKNISIVLMKVPCLIINKRFLIEQWTKYIKGNNDKKYNLCFVYTGTDMKKPFPKCFFNEIKEYQFEGRYFYGFKEADSYLTGLYGDYMKLPPEEQRVTHHHSVAFWKNDKDFIR